MYHHSTHCSHSMYRIFHTHFSYTTMYALVIHSVMHCCTLCQKFIIIIIYLYAAAYFVMACSLMENATPIQSVKQNIEEWSNTSTEICSSTILFDHLTLMALVFMISSQEKGPSIL